MKRDDPDFFNNLYRKGEINKQAEELKDKPESNISLDFYKYRHGLAPPSKNIRNIRYKKEPNEDSNEVHAVETILKDIIDYGFADNVEEELLEFNEKGELVKCTKGAKEKRRDTHLSGVGAGQHMLDEIEQMSLRSGSTSRPGGK